MPDEKLCDAVLPLAESTLHCELAASHTKPTGALPQGDPHKDSGTKDTVTGEPRTWWS